MQKSGKREIRQGFGDGLAAAFELAATPAIFGFLGWLLDSYWGVFPIFTLCFIFITVAYGSWRLYRDYTDRLERAAADRRSIWQAGS